MKYGCFFCVFFLNMFIYPEQRAFGTHQFSADCQHFNSHFSDTDLDITVDCYSELPYLQYTIQ